MPLAVTSSIAIPDDDLAETFVRAPGPGGQNVNKLATAVQLRFDMRGSRALSQAQKERLARLAGKRLTKEGVIVIEARRFRTQERNREDARDRLAALIEKALIPPKRRVKTKTPASQKRERLESKRRRSETKAQRKLPRDA